ncbi:MAG: 2Fe-2S iron-sulfur cluster binding domain-containing protein, partial [Eubacterium sp.]|nr:2Fe-2S iron-sulfur cluster binding domain-containing protein [Eubacterium sp.]
MKKLLKPKYVNDTALDILRREGVFICADCGGRGDCGKCRIKVASDAAISDMDREFLSDRELASGVRLACCLKVGEMPGAERGIEAEVPSSSL